MKRKKAESAGSPKKAKVMKKAAVMCAEDLVRKEFDDGSDDGKGDGNEDDTDGSLVSISSGASVMGGENMLMVGIWWAVQGHCWGAGGP